MVFVWAVIIYVGVLALTFIKTISEVLRNHTIGHKASCWFMRVRPEAEGGLFLKI
jgi:hypothetical protein